MNFKIPPTQKKMTQNEFLEILFNDLGYPRERRNKWLSIRTKRNIRYLDDLTPKEKTSAISDLKDLKAELLGQ